MKAFSIVNFIAVAVFVQVAAHAAEDAAPLKTIAPILQTATKAAEESKQPAVISRVASLSRLVTVLEQAKAGDVQPAKTLVANDDMARGAMVGMLLGLNAFDAAAQLSAQETRGDLIVLVADAQITAGDRAGALRNLAAFAPTATADGWRPQYLGGTLLSLPLERSWASSLVKCGDLPAAVQIAKSVRVPGARTFALVKVAEALIVANDLPGARQVLSTALDAARAHVVAEATAREKFAPDVTLLWDSFRFASIASAMHRAADPEANRLASEAIALSSRITDEHARCVALAQLGNVWSLAGDVEDARRAFDAAHGQAAKIADPSRRYAEDWTVAMTQAAIGEYEGSANAMLPYPNWEQTLTRFVDDGGFPKTPRDARRFVTAYANASLSTSTSAARMDRIRAAAKVDEGTSDGDLRFQSLKIADRLSAKDQAEAAGAILAYVERKNLDGAQAALDRAGGRSDAVLMAAVKLGIAWLEAGQFAKAKDVGIKAHAATEIEQLVRAFYNSGRIAEANAVLGACGSNHQIEQLTLYSKAQAIAVSGKPESAREVLAHIASFSFPENAPNIVPLIATLWAHKDAASATKWAAELKDVDMRAKALAAVVAAALEELEPASRTPSDPNLPRPPNPLTR